MPAFADLVAEYRQFLDLVQPALGAQQGQTSEGATEDKGNRSATLVPGLVRHASALMLLLKKEGNLEGARSLHIHRSDYTRLGGPALASEAANVAKIARQRLGDLARYGLTAEGLATLDADVAAFTASVPSPKVSIEHRKVSGRTFRNALKAADDFLNEDLKAGAELLADAHPLLFARLQEARRIDDASYGRSAQAKAKRQAKEAAKAKAANPDAGQPAA